MHEAIFNLCTDPRRPLCPHDLVPDTNGLQVLPEDAGQIRLGKEVGWKRNADRPAETEATLTQHLRRPELADRQAPRTANAAPAADADGNNAVGIHSNCQVMEQVVIQ